MKVVRLPSGPLACVYSIAAAQGAEDSAKSSGVFRAHSGSLHADGESEDEALEDLDRQVRRISIPPELEDGNVVASVAEPPTESRWAMRVRKCGVQRPDAPRGEFDTPSEGVTIPPPFTLPPNEANG